MDAASACSYGKSMASRLLMKKKESRKITNSLSRYAGFPETYTDLENTSH